MVEDYFEEDVRVGSNDRICSYDEDNDYLDNYGDFLFESDIEKGLRS